MSSRDKKIEEEYNKSIQIIENFFSESNKGEKEELIKKAREKIYKWRKLVYERLSDREKIVFDNISVNLQAPLEWQPFGLAPNTYTEYIKMKKQASWLSDKIQEKKMLKDKGKELKKNNILKLLFFIIPVLLGFLYYVGDHKPEIVCKEMYYNKEDNQEIVVILKNYKEKAEVELSLDLNYFEGQKSIINELPSGEQGVFYFNSYVGPEESENNSIYSYWQKIMGGEQVGIGKLKIYYKWLGFKFEGSEYRVINDDKKITCTLLN